MHDNTTPFSTTFFSSSPYLIFITRVEDSRVVIPITDEASLIAALKVGITATWPKDISHEFSQQQTTDPSNSEFTRFILGDNQSDIVKDTRYFIYPSSFFLVTNPKLSYAQVSNTIASPKLDALTKEVKEILPSISFMATEVTNLVTRVDVVQSSLSFIKTVVYALKASLVANTTVIGTL